jgi:hypothetical protein
MACILTVGLALRFPDLVGQLADSFIVGTHLDTPGYYKV